jgi:hypothetical protein
MPKLLYPSFLSDRREYQQAEAYWHRVWALVLGRAGQADEWQSPWLANSYADGTLCRTGNPIFTAVHPGRRLGVRVIQEPEGEPGDIDLDWWVDYVGEKAEPDAIRELVIACVLSDQTEAVVSPLLYEWVTGGKAAAPAPAASPACPELCREPESQA